MPRPSLYGEFKEVRVYERTPKCNVHATDTKRYCVFLCPKCSKEIEVAESAVASKKSNVCKHHLEKECIANATPVDQTGMQHPSTSGGVESRELMRMMEEQARKQDETNRQLQISNHKQEEQKQMLQDQAAQLEKTTRQLQTWNERLLCIAEMLPLPRPVGIDNFDQKLLAHIELRDKAHNEKLQLTYKKCNAKE